MPDVNLDRELHILVSDTPQFNSSTAVSNIVSGTASLEEVLVEGDLKFGAIYATKFEVQLYDESNLANKYIRVYIVEGTTTVPVFKGLIDSCKRDRVGADRQLIAYDLAYLFSKINVAWYWNLFWYNKSGQPATLKEIRNDFLSGYATAYNFQYDDQVDLPNDNIPFYFVTGIDSISYTSLLSMICELSCVFPHFNRSGDLEFLTLATNTADIDDLYEGDTSSFEETSTAAFTNVQIYDVNGNLVYDTDETQGSASKLTNPFMISNNIFVNCIMKRSDYEDVISAIADSIYTTVASIVYTPASINMIIGSFDYKLGQKVSTDNGTHYVFRNSYSGILFVEENIEAIGVEQNNEALVETSISERMLETTAEEFTYRIKEYTNNDAYTITDSSANILTAKITVTAEVVLAMHAELLLQTTPSDTTMELEFYYTLDDQLIVRRPVQTCFAGNQIITLYYNLELDQSTEHQFKIWVIATGGTAYLGSQQALVSIVGAGIVAEIEWDGNIEVEEQFSPITWSVVPSIVSDTAIISFPSILRNTAEDDISQLISGMPAIDDGIILNQLGMVYRSIVNAALVDTDCTVNSNGYWVGKGTIAQGNAAYLVTLEDVTDVEAISVGGGVDAEYQISPDSGNSWHAYVNGVWIEDGYMSLSNLMSIPASVLDGMYIRIKAIVPSTGTIYSINLLGGKVSTDARRYDLSRYTSNYTINNRYTTFDDDNNFILESSYSYTDAAFSIDTGYARKLSMPLSEFSSVTEINIKGGSILPFTPLKYLQSSGSQYINTGIKGSDTTKFELKVRTLSTATWPEIINASQSDNSSSQCCGVRLYSNTADFQIEYGPYATTTCKASNCQTGTDYELIVENNKLTYNGTEVSNTTKSFTITHNLNMFLFACNYQGNAWRHYTGRIYYCKIYQSGTLVRDFRPALDDNNVACMFDMVSKTFFYNQGSGTFTYEE